MLVCVKGCGLDSGRTSNEDSVEIVQDGGRKGQNKKCCSGEKQSLGGKISALLESCDVS